MIDLNKIVADSTRERDIEMRDRLNEALGYLHSAAKLIDAVYIGLVPSKKKVKRKKPVIRTLQEEAWQEPDDNQVITIHRTEETDAA